MKQIDNRRDQAAVEDRQVENDINICSNVMLECDEILPGMAMNRRSNPVMISRPEINRSENNTVD